MKSCIGLGRVALELAIADRELDGSGAEGLSESRWDARDVLSHNRHFALRRSWQVGEDYRVHWRIDARLVQ